MCALLLLTFTRFLPQKNKLYTIFPAKKGVLFGETAGPRHPQCGSRRGAPCFPLFPRTLFPSSQIPPFINFLRRALQTV